MKAPFSYHPKLLHSIVLLLIAIVATGGYAAIQAAADSSNPWTSVLPLQSASPSKSLEPHSISLKLRLPRSDGSEGALAEWRLVMPRAFLFSETGIRDSIGSRDGATYFATLAAIQTSDGVSFSPGIFAADKDQADVALITVGNRPANPKIKDICMRVNDHNSVFHDGYGGMSGCDTKKAISKRCSVRTGFEGWDVDILMPSQYYNGEYKIYCKSVREFLKKHTQQIAVLPSGM